MNIRDKQIIRKILEEINVTEAMIESIAAHKYQTLKMTDVWATLTEDITKLKMQLNDL